MGLPSWLGGKEMKAQSLSPEEALEMDMAATPTFLPGKPLDRGAWWAVVHGVPESRCDLATKTEPVLELFKYRFERTFSVNKVAIILSYICL